MVHFEFQATEQPTRTENNPTDFFAAGPRSSTRRQGCRHMGNECSLVADWCCTTLNCVQHTCRLTTCSFTSIVYTKGSTLLKRSNMHTYHGTYIIHIIYIHNLPLSSSTSIIHTVCYPAKWTEHLTQWTVAAIGGNDGIHSIELFILYTRGRRKKETTIYALEWGTKNRNRDIFRRIKKMPLKQNEKLLGFSIPPVWDKKKKVGCLYFFRLPPRSTHYTSTTGTINNYTLRDILKCLFIVRYTFTMLTFGGVWGRVCRERVNLFLWVDGRMDVVGAGGV